MVTFEILVFVGFSASYESRAWYGLRIERARNFDLEMKTHGEFELRAVQRVNSHEIQFSKGRDTLGRPDRTYLHANRS